MRSNIVNFQVGKIAAYKNGKEGGENSKEISKKDHLSG
jgi:hypothetical protein